jgi:8-oxo-dGTP pyrophosphatase MutT (NUDIX family)
LGKASFALSPFAWWKLMATSPVSIRQAAAIPVRGGQVCLVSSSSGKRWVIPKGCMEPGKTAGELALQEAWEEAGLLGTLQQEPVGSYLYEKYGNLYHVTVFLLNVHQAADDWPERTIRQRLWLNPAQALVRIDDRGLRELIRAATADRAELRA